jgi:K+ potassium transporter
MPSCSAMLKGPQHISVFLPRRSSKSVSKLKSEQPRGPRRAKLIVLLFVQRRGTGFIGKIFGPIMLAWFITIGVLGARGVMLAPGIWRPSILCTP